MLVFVCSQFSKETTILQPNKGRRWYFRSDVCSIQLWKKSQELATVCAIWHGESRCHKVMDHTQGECHEERWHTNKEEEVYVGFGHGTRQASSSLSRDLSVLICSVSNVPAPGTPVDEVGPVAAESGDPLVRCDDCPTDSDGKTQTVCCQPVCPRHYYLVCTNCM